MLTAKISQELGQQAEVRKQEIKRQPILISCSSCNLGYLIFWSVLLQLRDKDPPQLCLVAGLMPCHGRCYRRFPASPSPREKSTKSCPTADLRTPLISSPIGISVPLLPFNGSWFFPDSPGWIPTCPLTWSVHRGWWWHAGKDGGTCPGAMQAVPSPSSAGAFLLASHSTLWAGVRATEALRAWSHQASCICCPVFSFSWSPHLADLAFWVCFGAAFFLLPSLFPLPSSFLEADFQSPHFKGAPLYKEEMNVMHRKIQVQYKNSIEKTLPLSWVYTEKSQSCLLSPLPRVTRMLWLLQPHSSEPRLGNECPANCCSRGRADAWKPG